MSEQVVANPKLFISQYFDSIINQIDIHTEEQLEYYGKRGLIDRPFSYRYKPDNSSDNDVYNLDAMNDEQNVNTYGVETSRDTYSVWYNYEGQPTRSITPYSMRPRGYLNAIREEMIAQVQLIQAETFKRFEEIKNELELDRIGNDEDGIEVLKRSLFAKKFVGILRIDKVFTSWQEIGQVVNPLPFKLYLLVLDFYMDREQQHLLRSFIDKSMTGFMFFGEKIETLGKGLKDKEACARTFNMTTLRAYMLKEFIYGLVEHQNYVHVLDVRQSDVFCVDKVQIEETKLVFNRFDFSRDASKSAENDLFSNIKSIVVQNRPSKDPLKAKINSLACFSNLRCLHLDKLHLVDSSLENLTQLNRLELSECDFKCFKSDSFRHVGDNLEVLIIKEPKNYSHVNFSRLVRLQWLHVNDFSSFDFLDSLCDSLVVLKIVRLVDDSNAAEFFQHLAHLFNLRVLDLTGNKIEHIDGNWLSELVSLKFLTCDRVKGVDFNYEFFSRLESLDVSSSYLNSLNFAFAKLSNLKSLDLSNNRGLTLTSSIFSGLTQLEELRLAYINPRTGYHCISADLFQGLARLRLLSLYHNYLSHIDPQAFAHTPYLQQLDLGSNKLKPCQETFIHLSNLQLLDLASNDIESLDDGVFKYLNNLQTLSLRGNPIKLRRGTFNGLDKLTNLDLHLIEANHIDVRVFENLPSLLKVRIDQYFRKKQPELMDMMSDSKYSFVFRS